MCIYVCLFVRNDFMVFVISRKLQQENADLLHIPDDDVNLTEKETLEKAK